MFVALETLVRSVGKLSLSLSMQGDEMRVIVMPQGETKEPALRQPLILTAPPAELDAGFIDSLQGFSSAHKSLAEQVAATAAILESAEKSQAGKAQKTLAKASKPALPAPSSAGSESDSTDDDDEASEANEAEQSVTPAAQGSNAAGSEGGKNDLFSLL
jgi:PRTRC genetic system protein E